MPSVIKSRDYKKATLIWSGVFLIVVLVSAGILFYRAKIVSSDNQEYLRVQKIANLNAAAGKFDVAASLWVKYSSTTPSKNHRYQALLQSAALYITSGKYSLAAQNCQQVERAMGVTFQEAEVAAVAYSRMGQNQKAIFYYQQAIRLEPTGVDSPADKQAFKRAITQLSAKQ